MTLKNNGMAGGERILGVFAIQYHITPGCKLYITKSDESCKLLE